MIELGPDNIAGRTKALLVDRSTNTLYTGGVAGGLFKMVFDGDIASGAFRLGEQVWEYVPCNIGDEQLTLPITDLLRTSNGTIYIATGEGYLSHGVTDNLMSPKGRGLYTYNPSTGSFALVASTNPRNNADWTYINKLACLEEGGHTYFYAGTTEGLFRWNITTDADWNRPTKVYNGPVQDIEIMGSDNMLFFTSGNKLLKIGNVTGESQPVDISGSNPDFGCASRIEIAVAHSDKTYLYAMVADTLNGLGGVYLTTNQQTWTKLTTSTIVPFTKSNNGWHNSSLAINPANHKQIYIGGASLWVGQGFVENSYYQWNKLSYTESELNGGNYMGTVYSNSMFVHSGIHKILTLHEYGVTVYFIATDGGVYMGSDASSSFVALNKGLNITQFNGIGIAPDGSVIGGASENSCPFIQSRMAHDGGSINNTWYDNTTARNHMANVLWNGNGGKVEVSMFQQFKPQSRREVIVSSESGFGRAYADYSDYTNTQTWTQGRAFTSDKVNHGQVVPQMVLWETTNNTSFADSITFTIDTLGVIYRGNQEIRIGSSDFRVQRGDVIRVPSPAHLNYPFMYTFDHSFVVKDEMQHYVHNPISNRLFVTGIKTNGKSCVYMTSTPTDHRKVWSETEPNPNRKMNWSTIYECDYGFHVHAIAVSNDADALFVNVVDDTTGENYVLRVYNITSANPNNLQTVIAQLEFCKDWDGMMRTTLFDTLSFNGQKMLTRPITSMVFDTRAGKDDLIITLGGYDTTNTPNLYLVKNANNIATRTVVAKSVTNGQHNLTAASPVYCALVESTTGEVYVGTEEGVYVASANSFNGTPQWNIYGDFIGVPVMQIRQQTRALQAQRFETHTGINTENYVFAKTKYPNALYFATYGRGVFMDMKYVTDTVNEIVDESDYTGIRLVQSGNNTVSVYPNPASDRTLLQLTVTDAGRAVVNVYDVNGRRVYSRDMGVVAEGNHDIELNCSSLPRGLYLVNVNFGRNTATTKLVVR
ncbi:MAG: T9SS type A sorting domain-containing protein [Bacteroidales bacterium]|nr:T9SS type A sorting domain-containing protein [Bacteroidales bacterium]